MKRLRLVGDDRFCVLRIFTQRDYTSLDSLFNTGSDVSGRDLQCIRFEGGEQSVCHKIKQNCINHSKNQQMKIEIVMKFQCSWNSQRVLYN